jgi:CHASE2 domain-containing sensor protein
MIVMRDMIPDQVAHQFLKYFLQSFSEGNSFYLATREARERLKGLEDRLPCASWLPVIFQNPAETPPTWESLIDSSSTNDTLVTEKDGEVTKKEFRSKRKILSKLVLASIFISGLVTGIRYMGWLQFYELRAYDQFMQLRPQEDPDSRLLIVEQREQDLRNYDYPLPDRVLANVIQAINANDPAIIGLYLYRDSFVKEPLANQFQNQDNLIATCKFKVNQSEIIPPPDVPKNAQRIGFANLQQDPHYYSVRRYLLSRSNNNSSATEKCTTEYAFGFLIAYQYLESMNDKYIDPKAPNVDSGWTFYNRQNNTKTVFKELHNHSAGYNNIDDGGNQILLNYRQTKNIARKISVTEILQKDFRPELIKDKIVLIGNVAPSISEGQFTPLGKMPGVYIEAHATSQILSAFQNKRPMISWFPYWIDAILITVSSLIGTWLTWFLRKDGRKLLLLFSISLIGVYGIYFFGFLQGLWLPLVPSILAFISAAIYAILQKQKLH